MKISYFIPYKIFGTQLRNIFNFAQHLVPIHLRSNLESKLTSPDFYDLRFSQSCIVKFGLTECYKVFKIRTSSFIVR